MSDTLWKFVLVEWVDSHSGDGWRPLDEITDAAEPVRCRSVGWLAAKSDTTTVLVAHLSGEAQRKFRMYGKGDIAIPNVAIRKVTVLRPEGSKK